MHLTETTCMTYDNNCVNYIYDEICNPKNKNIQGLSVEYCKSCDKVYTNLYNLEYKWCGITYYTELKCNEYN